MDIFNFIFSVNKISLIAFFGTLMILIYEIYLLKKEKNKEIKPNIPQFTSSQYQKPTEQKILTTTESPKQQINKKNPNSIIIITVLVIMLFLFGGMTIYSFFININRVINNKKVTSSNISVNEINSKGIKLFDLQWNEIQPNHWSKIKSGEKIYITVETVDNADIDRARIRINEKQWKIDHITMMFKKEKNAFYKDFTIATGTSRLKIDAELHSTIDGWLGD